VEVERAVRQWIGRMEATLSDSEPERATRFPPQVPQVPQVPLRYEGKGEGVRQEEEEEDRAGRSKASGRAPITLEEMTAHCAALQREL